MQLGECKLAEFIRMQWLWNPLTVGLGLAATVAVIAGCVSTLEGVAPPVNAAMIEVARNEGSDAEALDRGRLIYITRCAQCHSVLPVGQYSRQEWDRILPDMAQRTRLDGNQAAELRAYVMGSFRN